MGIGLIETEIMELRGLCKAIMDGSVTNDTAKTMIGTYNQIAKRENMLLQIAMTAEKNGGRDKMWKRLNNMNVINDKTAIDLGDTPDKFKCPLKGESIISRDECLDASGASCNIDFCQGCEQFTITRRSHD